MVRSGGKASAEPEMSASRQNRPTKETRKKHNVLVWTPTFVGGPRHQSAFCRGRKQTALNDMRFPPPREGLGMVKSIDERLTIMSISGHISSKMLAHYW